MRLLAGKIHAFAERVRLKDGLKDMSDAEGAEMFGDKMIAVVP